MAERRLRSCTRANLQGWLYPTEGDNEARLRRETISGSGTGSVRKRRTSRLHLTSCVKFLMKDSSNIGGTFSMQTVTLPWGATRSSDSTRSIINTFRLQRPPGFIDPDLHIDFASA